ncbi:MAG: AAA family ATPase [Polaromonas sp.]|nr:AAA family ATPase [Polaromonas sp.]
MYLDHFGLQEFPFSITPGTKFFFASHTSQEALNTLKVAVMMGEGFMKVTGEVGTGKTLLCRKLIASLDEQYQVAYIINPYLEPLALFVELAAELGVERPKASEASQHHVLDALMQRVIALNKDGKRVVICLDEVQAMPIETLEALRLLTNFETEHRKLLQVIIFGQPELEERLNHHSVRQLRQRITFHYQLKPLSNAEFGYYIQHRLAVVGYRRGRLFTPMAMWMLGRKSRRIPRLINILANKAMLSAYGKGKRLVGLGDVMRAVDDTDSVSQSRGWSLVVLLVGLVAVTVVMALAAYQWVYFK